MPLIRIDQDRCRREGACIDVCPYSLLTRGPGDFPVEVAGALDACIRCGQCVAVCAAEALTNAHLPREGFEDLSRIHRQADPVRHAMLTRRSVRSFLEEPLPRAELQALLDVVRFAPTGNNAQRLWWIVTTGREQTAPLAALAGEWVRQTYFPNSLPEDWGFDRDPVLRGAPHLAVCCAPESSAWAVTDAAIATAHLELLASARGLGACWAGTFLRALGSSPALAEALHLPEDQRACAALILGRPRHVYHLAPPRKPAAVDWR